jgi:hypothetical protein
MPIIPSGEVKSKLGSQEDELPNVNGKVDHRPVSDQGHAVEQHRRE